MKKMMKPIIGMTVLVDRGETSSLRSIHIQKAY